MRRICSWIATFLFIGAAPALAHPSPFSFLDVRVGERAVDVALVAHVFDVGHDLNIPDLNRLLDSAFLNEQRDAVIALLSSRVRLSADGNTLVTAGWSVPEAVPDRQSVRLRARFPLQTSPGVLSIAAAMFPYDPQHQTFVNVYERDVLVAQAILGKDKSHVDHFPGTRQGTLAVIRKFAASGVHHILIGPDHLLFLVGLLLLGGPIRQLVLVVTAFTLAHSVTLSVAALDIFTPPARIVEPAIALSIIYVGADNILVRGGRDMRGWIAFGFGLIHGFGFASVLRDMDLPPRALGWSLFSFNLGVELGQLVVVLAAASLFAAIRSRSEAAGRRLAFAGSIVVIAAGTFWFVQRVL